jgi:REP element-mobilizing transposase RayT
MLFSDDRDRSVYLELLARESGRRGWSVLSYCQMTNHLHVLLRTPSTDLGAGFKRVHEVFARHINQTRAQHGHLFGSRFYNGLVQTDLHLLGCFRYIARNPVDAGMCAVPSGWRWSAHRALLGLSEPPSFLDLAGAHDLLGANGADPRLAYLQLVEPSDADLLAAMASHGKTDWVISAVDDLSIPIQEIARFMGVHPATARRRLSAAREQSAREGTVPSGALRG